MEAQSHSNPTCGNASYVNYAELYGRYANIVSGALYAKDTKAEFHTGKYLVYNHGPWNLYKRGTWPGGMICNQYIEPVKLSTDDIAKFQCEMLACAIFIGNQLLYDERDHIKKYPQVFIVPHRKRHRVRVKPADRTETKAPGGSVTTIHEPHVHSAPDTAQYHPVIFEHGGKWYNVVNVPRAEGQTMRPPAFLYDDDYLREKKSYTVKLELRLVKHVKGDGITLTESKDGTRVTISADVRDNDPNHQETNLCRYAANFVDHIYECSKYRIDLMVVLGDLEPGKSYPSKFIINVYADKTVPKDPHESFRAK